MATTTNTPALRHGSFAWTVGHRHRNGLTASQKGYIFANYESQTIEEMANRIGKTVKCVRRFAQKYGLVKKAEPKVA